MWKNTACVCICRLFFSKRETIVFSHIVVCLPQSKYPSSEPFHLRACHLLTTPPLCASHPYVAPQKELSEAKMMGLPGTTGDKSGKFMGRNVTNLDNPLNFGGMLATFWEQMQHGFTWKKWTCLKRQNWWEGGWIFDQHEHGEYNLVGGFNHLENICRWEGLSHLLWKIKNVPNHQPVI